MYTDIFVTGIKTVDIFEDFNLKDLIDFSNIEKEYDFFGNENEKVVDKCSIETYKKTIELTNLSV